MQEKINMSKIESWDQQRTWSEAESQTVFTINPWKLAILHARFDRWSVIQKNKRWIIILKLISINVTRFIIEQNRISGLSNLIEIYIKLFSLSHLKTQTIWSINELLWWQKRLASVRLPNNFSSLFDTSSFNSLSTFSNYTVQSSLIWKLFLKTQNNEDKTKNTWLSVKVRPGVALVRLHTDEDFDAQICCPPIQTESRRNLLFLLLLLLF